MIRTNVKEKLFEPHAYIGNHAQYRWHRGFSVQCSDEPTHGFDSVSALFVMVNVIIIGTLNPIRLVFIQLQVWIVVIVGLGISARITLRSIV